MIAENIFSTKDELNVSHCIDGFPYEIKLILNKLHDVYNLLMMKLMN